MEDSKNRGTPRSIIHFYRMFPYKPSILGYPHDYGNQHISSYTPTVTPMGIKSLSLTTPAQSLVPGCSTCNTLGWFGKWDFYPHSMAIEMWNPWVWTSGFTIFGTLFGTRFSDRDVDISKALHRGFGNQETGRQNHHRSCGEARTTFFGICWSGMAGKS